MTPEEVRALGRCLAADGVAVFPSDTVYGLACDPESRRGVERLYALKGRERNTPAAVMFFDVDQATTALPELGEATGTALAALLPGGATLLLPNPEHRFTLACAGDPDTLGLRVPALAGALAPLGVLRKPVLQSSANRSGGPDARRLDEVPDAIRRGADLVLGAGDLAGTPSTVIDLREYEETGRWAILRRGAVSASQVAAALA